MADQVRPVYRLYQLIWTGLDLLFPPQCGGCEISGTRWCVSCQNATHRITLPICVQCGKQGQSSGLCDRCRTHSPAYAALRSWAVFEGPIRQAIHKLKYERDIGLGEVLSRALCDLLESCNWDIDIIIPVPLGIARHTERGYNQAALLAIPMALKTGLSYRPKAIRRIRETQSQVGLSFEERVVNVNGAFLASSKTVYGKHVLVVDDVTTSGATMGACAQALLNAGAERIYGLTLARAI